MTPPPSSALEDAVLTAIDLTGIEREQFLGRLRLENAELHVQVSRLVARYDQSRGMLRTPPVGGQLPAGFDPDEDPLVGRRLGDYRLVRFIGRGGMGRVYEAIQTAPERRVAVKVLTGQSLRSQALKRFAREAQALATLEHPGICRIIQAGSAQIGADWVHFIAMELVEGAPLCEAAAPLGVRDRIELIAKVCDAVGHAHSRGVIHRDLKPGNVLVIGPGAGGDGEAGLRPKVVDFGIACMLGAESQITTTQTPALGTLEYMGPEQLGDAGPDGDARSDVYAIGVMLYEVLAGRRPFERPSAAATAANILAAPPVPPLSGFVPSLTGSDGSAIDAIIAKALDRRVESRYATATDLGNDLRAFLTHGAISARTARGRTRARGAWILAGIAALTLAVGGTVFMRMQRGPDAIGAPADPAAARWASYGAAVHGAQKAVESGDRAAARSLLDRAPSEHRDWEWGYFRSICEPVAQLTLGAGGRFDIQEETMVSFGSHHLYRRNIEKREIELLDRSSMTVTARFPGVAWEEVFRLGFAAGDRTLVVSSRGTLRTIEATTGRVIAQRSGLRNEDKAFDISPDGTRLAIGGDSGRIRILALPGLESVSDFAEAHGIYGLNFSPAGDAVLVQTDEQALRLRRLSDGVFLWQCEGAPPRAEWARFSPDGRLVYFLTFSDHALNVADGATGKLMRRTIVTPNPFQLKMHPDGRRVVLACEDGAVQLYPTVPCVPAAGPWTPVVLLHITPSFINSVSIAPDGRQIFVDVGPQPDVVLDSSLDPEG